MRRKRSPVVERLEERLCMDAGSVPPMYPNSPIPLPTNGAWTQTPFYGSPVFADLKGDGHQELLVEVAGGKMIAYGTDASGKLVPFQQYVTQPLSNGVQANFKSTPVVVTVPGYGRVIVAALGRDEAHPGAVEDGRVYAFNAVTGAVLWVQDTNLPAPDLNGKSGVTGALTVGFLEGDGVPDVIVDSFSTEVSAFRVSDGTRLWRYNNDDTVEAGAVVADLFGDGRQEVVFASGISVSQYYPAYYGFITILNQDGSLLRRIPVGENISGSPIVADLFGDGRKEIITAPRGYFNTAQGSNYRPTPAQAAAAQAAGNRVYAFYPEGTLVPGWPYHTTTDDALNHQVWKEPVAADLYGNGRAEVMVVDRMGVLHVIAPGGQDAPGFEGGKLINPGRTTDVFSSPIVADVNGDGLQDVVVSSQYVLAAYDKAGKLIFSTSTPNPTGGFPDTVMNAAAYGQFDPSGSPVLAFVSDRGAAPGQPADVTIFSLPRTNAAPAWPMLRRNAMGQAVLISPGGEEGFVAGAYQALFLRPATPDDLNYYVPLLTNQIITRADLAAKLAKAAEGVRNFPGKLNVSDADTIRKVSAIYAAIGATLQPDSQAAILYDSHRGRTFDDAAIQIVASGGNYAAAGDIGSWARSIFRDSFNVNPSPDATAGVVRSVDAGAAFGDVVKSLLNTSDARKVYVIGQIAKYLGRPVRTSDFALANYSHREDVVTAIVSSAEYFARVGNNLTNYVNAAYKALFGFTPDAATNASWVSRISKGTATRATLAHALVVSPIYYHQFVTDTLFKLIPDPAKGVLPFQLGSAQTPATNPDQNLVNGYTNQLVKGTATQETVLASMMTTPQYYRDSTYFRGVYASPNVRL